MALTDAQARRALPGEKDYKLADSGGLYLLVKRNGGKVWRQKYRFAGREKLLTHGPYPDVSLADAREARDDAKKQLRSRSDPGLAKRKARAAIMVNAENTFEAVGRRWFAVMSLRWSRPHADTVLESLERDLFPQIGGMPIVEIDVPLILKELRRIENRGAIETAHRVRQRASAIFVHGISEGACENDPAAIVKKALRPIADGAGMPALTSVEHLRELIVAVDRSTADVVTRLASRLLALTALRPGSFRQGAWAEIEGIAWDEPDAPAPAAAWRVPAQRLKLDREAKGDEKMELVVPLSSHAVDTLRALRRVTGAYKLMFPTARNAQQPLSENALGFLYKRLGYGGRHVPHGWRAAFSTIMNERAERAGRPADQVVVDLMLGHVPTGTSGSERAYNRAGFMPRRREIAQEWSELLLNSLPAPNDLIDHYRR